MERDRRRAGARHRSRRGCAPGGRCDRGRRLSRAGDYVAHARPHSQRSRRSPSHPSIHGRRRHGAQRGPGARGQRGRCGVSRRAGVRPGTVANLRARRCPIVPGIATASELQAAWNFGLEFVKVFPASTLGGPPALRMLASICADMRFMPTGGIGVDDLARLPGDPGGRRLRRHAGSRPPELIASGDFDGIARRAATAVAIARSVRAAHRG